MEQKIECTCYTEWLACDETRRVTEHCPIHGPNGTEALKKQHLVQQHERIKKDRLDILRGIEEAVIDELCPPRRRRPGLPGHGEQTDQQAELIAKGITAALLHIREKLNGNLPYSPTDTYERIKLVNQYGYDPEARV